QYRKQLGAKSRKVAICLALIGSFWGLHNWYLGRNLRAMASLMFSVTMIPCLMSLYDAFRFFTESNEEFDAEFNPVLTEFYKLSADQTVQQLRELHRLTQEGALTQAEFEREKGKILGQDAPAFAEQLGVEIMPLVGTLLKQATHEMAESVLANVVQSTRKAKNKKRRNKYLK
ncbi:MAG: NINE protein, partial [Myxococcota bacterium]|nr:NINE protein [Myxococcota bacterium]